jgi:hypothetical protein
MLIDEAQKVFPIRSRSAAVPAHVSELETHRHKGIDLFLVTQHPHLVDTHVRKLVDRHFHVVRVFGSHNATVYEFPTGVQDQPEKNKHKNGVVRHQWRYPKAVFKWYRSAELHTVKRRLPAKVWLFVAVLLCIPVALWFAYDRIVVKHGGMHQAAHIAPGAASGVRSGAVRPGAARSGFADLAAVQAAYLEQYRARIAGLPFTAPAYDAMTKPVEAPYPAVCGYAKDFPCRCWSQRGYALETPKALCERLAREPMDPWWRARGPNGLVVQGYAGGGAAAPARVSDPEPAAAAASVPALAVPAAVAVAE